METFGMDSADFIMVISDKCWILASTRICGTLVASSVALLPRSYRCPELEDDILFTRYGTSSTAQGGGGSFKKRKTIGEIACCESRMSEQKHWPTD